VLDEKNRASFRWLRTGREWPEQIEIKAGLREGERIVAVRQPGLRDGDLVKVTADE